MEQHVKIIGVLDIVFGILGIIAGFGLLVMFMVGGAGISSTGQEGAGSAGAALAGIGLIGGLFVIAISGFEVYVGTQLRQYKSWARVVQIIIAVLMLPGFPVGTALGIYYLWAMLNKDTVDLFEEKNTSMPRAA
jgi:hypothetical protein